MSFTLPIIGNCKQKQTKKSLILLAHQSSLNEPTKTIIINYNSNIMMIDNKTCAYILLLHMFNKECRVNFESTVVYHWNNTYKKNRKVSLGMAMIISF